MSTDAKFVVWCAQKCVHLWDAPEEVKSWLADPKLEGAAGVAEAARAALAADEAEGAGWAAWTALRAARATRAAAATAWAAEVARAAAKALGTRVGQLRLDYVATWTDEQLAQASGDWIEPATVEIFERAAESRL